MARERMFWRYAFDIASEHIRFALAMVCDLPVPLCHYRHGNLTKLRPLFTLSHRGSHIYLLITDRVLMLIILTNQKCYFYATEIILKPLTFWLFRLSTLDARDDAKSINKTNSIIFRNTYLPILYAIRLSENLTQYANYLVHTKFTWTRSVMGSYGELSNLLSDSLNNVWL